MDQILDKLRHDYPSLEFKPGQAACWMPNKNTVFYEAPFNEKQVWSLCHEIGHAVSGHRSFNSDVDLLLKELEAWEEAKKIVSRYNLSIDDSHMEACLDSYRDWIFKRSTCPKCRLKGIQQDTTLYSCVNCQTNWTVSSNQTGRPYRVNPNKNKRAG